MSKFTNMIGECLICQKQIQDNQSYYHCTGDTCFWHQKCMKQKYRYEYDDKLASGYNYAAPHSYKTTKCPCALKIHKKTRQSKRVRRVAKVAAPIGLVSAGIVAAPILILPGIIAGCIIGMIKTSKL